MNDEIDIGSVQSTVSIQESNSFENLLQRNVQNRQLILRALDENLQQSLMLKKVLNVPDGRDKFIASSTDRQRDEILKLPAKPKRTGTRKINTVPFVMSSREYIDQAEAQQNERREEEERKQVRREVLAGKRKIKVEAEEEKKKTKRTLVELSEHLMSENNVRGKENSSCEPPIKKRRGRPRKNLTIV